MNKTEYMNKRKALLDEAQALIDAGKLEDFEAKKKEIEDLDADYQAKAEKAADLRALSETPALVDAFGSGTGAVVGSTSEGSEVEDLYDSIEYRRAFMNYVIKGEAIPE